MKTKLLQEQGQKTYVLVFDTGDEVIAGLLDFARTHDLGGSHFTAIGAFSTPARIESRFPRRLVKK